MHQVERVLVMAHAEADARSLASLLTDVGVPFIHTAVGLQQGRERIHDGIDAVFTLETTGHELTALAVARASRVFPAPFVVSVGVMDVKARLALMRRGVVAYLPWPATRAEVFACFATLASVEVSLESILRFAVGRLSLREIHQCVREVTLVRALHASNGSRRGAAKILGVTRPAIQRMVKEVDDSARQRELQDLFDLERDDENVA